MTSVLLSMRGTCDWQGMVGPLPPLGSGQGPGPFLLNVGCSLVGPKERWVPQPLVHLRQRPYAPGKQVLLGKGLWMEMSARVPRADLCQPAPSASPQPQEWTVADLLFSVTLSARDPRDHCRGWSRASALPRHLLYGLAGARGLLPRSRCTALRGLQKKGLGLPGQVTSVTWKWVQKHAQSRVCRESRAAGSQCICRARSFWGEVQIVGDGGVGPSPAGSVMTRGCGQGGSSWPRR